MKKVLALVAVASMAAGAYAEPNRPLYTRENRAPDLHQLEVGGMATIKGYENADVTDLGVYGRYGLISNVTFGAMVPFRMIDTDFGDEESGLGDVVVDLQLLAWQDIFEYPWVIPYVKVGLPTGDDEEGLGTGETVYTPGISVGSRMYDHLSLIADVGYAVEGYTGELGEQFDAWVFSGSAIWDISARFSALAEFQVLDVDADDDNAPSTFVGGLTYDFTPDFELTAYFGVGGGSDYAEDSIIAVKGAYTF